MSDLDQLCDEVETLVGPDAGDLCWNLIEQGVIPTTATAAEAARIVAQYLEQA